MWTMYVVLNFIVAMLNQREIDKIIFNSIYLV